MLRNSKFGPHIKLIFTKFIKASNFLLQSSDQETKVQIVDEG